MDKTDAAAGKRKKTQLNKTGNGPFCCRKAQQLAHWEWSSLLQPSFLPASVPTVPRRATSGPRTPPRSSVRSLSCCRQRTEVVSCEDEEFEAGCRSAPSSGGVWRNASWGYIKHWLMLRNHEFWKIQLRNEQNLKLHVACKSTGTGGCWGPLKSRPRHVFFLKSWHCSQEEPRAMYICRGRKPGPTLFPGKSVWAFWLYPLERTAWDGVNKS